VSKATTSVGPGTTVEARLMTSYLARIQAEAANRRAARDAIRAERNKPLHIKIDEWFEKLPAYERKTHYTMAELLDQFGGAAGAMGLALDKLGWKRRRKWSGAGPYSRYWQPACIHET